MNSWNPGKYFSGDSLFRRTLMVLRLLISDTLWSTIEPVLQKLKHSVGAQKKRRIMVPVSENPLVTDCRLSTNLHVSCADECIGLPFELVGGELQAMLVLIATGHGQGI